MTKLTQNSWLGGQMDVRMTGRQDMKNYRNGASVLKNFVPVKLGSIRKRPGTDYVADITGKVGSKFRMIPFGYTSGKGYVIVFAQGRAYVYSASGYEGVALTTGYADTELDEISYVQCNDILYLAHRNHKPKEIRHASGGWTVSDIAFVRTTETPVAVSDQSTGNPMPCVRRNFLKSYQRGGVIVEKYKASAVVVDGDGNEFETNPSPVVSGGEWTADGEGNDLVGEAWKSYVSEEIKAGRMTYQDVHSPIPDWFYNSHSAESVRRWYGVAYHAPWTASQTITVKFSFPAPGLSVRKYRIYKDAGGVYGLVGESPSWDGTFVDNNISPDTSVTPIDENVTNFKKTGDYPGCVGLYQQRLVWASSENDPARIWMSMAGDFYEYRPHEKLQLDDAIDFILPITQFPKINFITELGRLFVFSEQTELIVGSSSSTQGISYETILATEQSHLGCTKRLPPIVANNTLLFVNRTGQSVRDYDEQIGSMRFGGTDVSVFASGIFADNPIVDWTWQQEPNSTVWCVLADGRLASFTYDKEQQIAAWAVHELGGGGKARGIAKTCAVFGREAGRPTTGEVMVAVERGAESEEGGARRVTLERMRPWGARRSEEQRVESEELCMDCMESGRVEGKTVVELEDGTAVSGYTFESVMTTMPPVIGDNVGQAQFDVKLGQHAHLRTVGSQGGEIYAVGMRSQPSSIDEGAVRDGEDGAGYRDVDVVLAGSNNRDGRVTVRHDAPWPFQLALLELDYEVES